MTGRTRGSRIFCYFNASIWPIGMFPAESTTVQAANRDEYRGCSRARHPRQIDVILFFFVVTITANTLTRSYNLKENHVHKIFYYYKIFLKSWKDQTIHFRNDRRIK